MVNIPSKCSRCRAPIDWDDGAVFTKCEFCGFKNYLTNYDQTEVFKNDSKKFKISNFKNPFNRSFKISIGFFKSKFKSTKSLFSKNKKTILYIIIAGVFTSIAIPSIKNYSDFIANKRKLEQIKKVNEKIIKEDQISGTNKLIVQDTKEEKVLEKTKKERPQWMAEKIKGCSKYKTRKQIDYCINIYSPYGNPLPEENGFFALEQKPNIPKNKSFISTDDKLMSPSELREKAFIKWDNYEFEYAYQLHTLAIEKEGDNPDYSEFAARGNLSFENNLRPIKVNLDDFNMTINNYCLEKKDDLCDWAFLRRGNIKEKNLNDIRGALVDIEEAIKRDRSWDLPYFYKSRILFNLGNFEEFNKVQIKAYRKLNYWYSFSLKSCSKSYLKGANNGRFYANELERCENFTELSFMRAKYYLKKGKYRKASRNINKALELKPNNEEFLELKTKISKKDISL